MKFDRNHMPTLSALKRVLLNSLIVFSLVFIHACGQGLNDKEYVQQAKEKQDQGKYEAGIIALKNALQINPDNLEARWLLGEMYIEVGQGEYSEKELLRAQKLGVAREAIIIPLSKAYLLQGKFKELIKEFRPTPQMSPDLVAELHVNRGKAYLGMGNIDAASQEFQTALETQKDSVTAWHGQALINYVKGQLEKAAEWNNKVLKEAPQYAESLALKGDIFMAQKEYAQAEMSYKSAVDARPLVPLYRVGLAIAKINTAKYDEAVSQLDVVLKTNPNNVIGNYFRSVALYKKRDYKNAIISAEKAILLNPNHLPSRLISGASNYAIGNMEQAYTHVQAFVASAPNFVMARKLLAAIQINMGRVEEAASLLQGTDIVSEDDKELMEAIGNAAVKSGDLKLGSKLLAKVVQRQPDKALARVQLGLAQVMLGQQQQGMGELEKALALDPKLQAAKYAIILSHMRAGEFDKALAQAKEAQAAYPDSPYGYIFSGFAYGSKGQLSDAKSAFMKAEKVNHGDPIAGSMLAVFALKDGDAAEARRWYRQILKYNPGHMQTLLLLADLDTSEKQYKQALVSLEEATYSNPTALLPRILLSRAYLAQGQFPKALLSAEEGLKKYPDDPALVEVVGRVYLQTGQADKAVGLFERLVKARPKAISARYHLALSYEQLGNIAGAQRELEEVLKQYPGYIQAKMTYARVLVKANRLDKAEQELAILKKQVKDASALLELEAYIALARNKPQEAVKLYQAALEKQENNILVLQLAKAQFSAGSHDASHATLLSWLKKHPDDVLTRSTLADSLLGIGKLNEARNQYEMVVRQKPKHIFALNNLAWILLQQGKLDEAQTRAEKAYELAPQVAHISDTLGVILTQRGELKQALRLFRKASERAPDDLGIKFHLAESLVRNGQREEAKKTLRSLLATQKSFSKRSQAQDLLQELEKE